MSWDPNHTQEKIQKLITEELQQLQASGYIVPENTDHEVGLAISVTAHNLSRKCVDVMNVKEYVRLEGKFYSKEAIKRIKPIER